MTTLDLDHCLKIASTESSRIAASFLKNNWDTATALKSSQDFHAVAIHHASVFTPVFLQYLLSDDQDSNTTTKEAALRSSVSSFCSLLDLSNSIAGATDNSREKQILKMCRHYSNPQHIIDLAKSHEAQYKSLLIQSISSDSKTTLFKKIKNKT